MWGYEMINPVLWGRRNAVPLVSVLLSVGKVR